MNFAHCYSLEKCHFIHGLRFVFGIILVVLRWCTGRRFYVRKLSENSGECSCFCQENALLLMQKYQNMVIEGLNYGIERWKFWHKLKIRAEAFLWNDDLGRSFWILSVMEVSFGIQLCTNKLVFPRPKSQLCWPSFMNPLYSLDLTGNGNHVGCGLWKSRVNFHVQSFREIGIILVTKSDP